jgi:flagellar FliJ protein
MANPTHPLQAAARVAQSHEQEAARALTASQKRFVEQQNRLQQLLAFRGEYATQFQAEGQGGISARRFQDYSAFLNNLDVGITQSQQQLERFRQELLRQQQTWVRTHAKARALGELIERDRKEQLRQEDQREQRDSDERNLRGLAIRQLLTGGA